MFGKALEVALKRKFPDIEDPPTRRIFARERIKRAAAEHRLTPELADWADHVRFLRNDAAHDEDPFTEQQVKEMAAFTDLILRYMFTLPEDLKIARSSEAAE